jgi:acetyltransferase-like isoleucine patch superfamily enzyme
VHRTALCESSDVGGDTRVGAFAHIERGAAVGTGCNICDHTYIEGGARIGNGVTVKNGVSVWDGVNLDDEVFVGPNVAFTNDRVPRARPHRTPRDMLLPTVVREGAVLGANATIVCGVTIGRHALVGAGAVVTRDVADFAVVMGAPARRAGWICACGERLDRSLTCHCGERYREVPAGDRIVALEPGSRARDSQAGTGRA